MPGDLFSAPAPKQRYIDDVDTHLKQLRVGLLYHDLILEQPVGPDCVAAVEVTGQLLESLGHHVEFAFPPALTGATGLGLALGIISASGLAARLDAWSERTGHAIDATDVEPHVWARAEQGRTFSAVQVHAAFQRLITGVMRVPEWWAAGYDLLVTPTMQQPPPKIAGLTLEQQGAIFGLFTMPYSITGQPAISLPLHWNSENLPIGVQIVADYGREDLLIQVAAQLEEAQPWMPRWLQMMGTL
jgi:amidase